MFWMTVYFTQSLPLSLLKVKDAPLLIQIWTLLIVSSAMNTSAKYVANVATETSWNRLWDLALDRGTNGTTQLQRIIFHLSKRTYQGFICPLCQLPIDPNIPWISHICFSHSVTLNSMILTPDDITNLLCLNNEHLFNIKFPKQTTIF